MVQFVKEYGVVNGRKQGLYKCHCGLLFTSRIASVNYGATKSCGCLRVANVKRINDKRKNNSSSNADSNTNGICKTQ